jgi:putative transposase
VEDHVERENTGLPNELWVADFTDVPTWSGIAFTVFVTDLSSRPHRRLETMS